MKGAAYEICGDGVKLTPDNIGRRILVNLL